MTREEALVLLIDGMNYAAYKETGSSLHDSDMNRLFGSENCVSGRPVYEPSPWMGEDFEQKMATLLGWASVLNHWVPEFRNAKQLLEDEDSPMGRVIRYAKRQQAK
jgi:hypothetical protein